MILRFIGATFPWITLPSITAWIRVTLASVSHIFPSFIPIFYLRISLLANVFTTQYCYFLAHGYYHDLLDWWVPVYFKSTEAWSRSSGESPIQLEMRSRMEIKRRKIIKTDGTTRKAYMTSYKYIHSRTWKSKNQKEESNIQIPSKNKTNLEQPAQGKTESTPKTCMFASHISRYVQLA